MSISINKEKCIACGKCLQVCPGNLLYPDEMKKVDIRYPKDCWGCAACLKECSTGAIKYSLGADIGGKGTFLYTKNEKDTLSWFIVKDSGTEKITISKKDSNKY